MRKISILAAFIVMIAVMTGCKTNENNYRAAYDAAVAQREESSGVDSTIYARIRNEARMNNLVVAGDTLPIRTEYIGYTDGGGSSRENVMRYNVVVGQFKQIFNAKAMRTRLLEQGYPDAMIVHTREPLYYVVTGTYSSAVEAAEALRKVNKDRNLVLKSPLPFILQPAHLAR